MPTYNRMIVVRTVVHDEVCTVLINDFERPGGFQCQWQDVFVSVRRGTHQGADDDRMPPRCASSSTGHNDDMNASVKKPTSATAAIPRTAPRIASCPPPNAVPKHESAIPPIT